MRLFEFESDIFLRQSLCLEIDVYTADMCPRICCHFDIPAASQVVAGLKDVPLHISAVMNINDPCDLLELAIKGHITPFKNKLYSAAQKMTRALFTDDGKSRSTIFEDKGGRVNQ